MNTKRRHKPEEAWDCNYTVFVMLYSLPGCTPDVFDDLESVTVDSLPPVEMPDIPDFTD